MDTRFKTENEIYINELIKYLKETGTLCIVRTEDDMFEYYYACGKFYKETNSDEFVLSEAQFEDELTYYKHIAKSRFVNGQVCIFNLIE